MDPIINNPCFTTEEWLDALEGGDIFDVADNDAENA
jgi:hypothetical protein